MPCLRIGRVTNLWMKLFESSQIKSSQIKFCLEIINLHTSIPSIAQLVERRTVDVKVVILRSLVRIRLEGIFFSLLIVKFPIILSFDFTYKGEKILSRELFHL